jgi:hypothetical protein
MGTFLVLDISKMPSDSITQPVLNASNLTNQYISYSMALFSPNEIRTFFFVEVITLTNSITALLREDML